MALEKPLRRRSGRERPLIEDDTGRRPFMRGIMVHSLLSRGASFEEAYKAASEVRDKIRGREVVRREELAAMIEGLFAGGRGLEEKRLPLTPSIQVVGDGSRAPFSKGLLSQSLLAAAVEYNEAYEVAREIEAALVQARVAEITREDLRTRVAESLERRLGERAASRYRVWRAFQGSDRPMILLLGGAAGVGKTTLAQEVAHRLGIARVTSTDSIRQVMRIMLSPELVPVLHASSYEAHQVMGDAERAEDPVVEGFRSQAATVGVGVRAIIERAIAENTDLILEGVSILPGQVALSAYGDSAHVIFLVVATLDEDAFRRRFAARGRSARQRPTHRYLQNLEEILRIQDDILEAADQFDVPIVDNGSFEASVRSVLRHVTETLREQGGFGDASSR